MFDLRYHVASLTAVFLALVIGILVGVGISDRGLVDSAKRSLLEQRVAQLQSKLDQASQTSELSQREQRAAQLYINETYPVLVRNRLRGKRIAVLFAGSIDNGLRSAIDRALTDAGATQVRLSALKMPLDVPGIEKQLSSASSGDLQRYHGKARLGALGRELGDELVSGGDTPLWNALTDKLVEEGGGNGRQPVDGVIVARTAPPQRGAASRFLLGLYEGLGAHSVPAVGVESTVAVNSAVDAFRSSGLSSVDDLDKTEGRLALVLLLGGAPPAQYGLKESADQPLPPFPVSGASG